MIDAPPAIENSVPGDRYGLLTIFRSVCLEGTSRFHVGEIQEIDRQSLPPLVTTALDRTAPVRKISATDTLMSAKYYRLLRDDRDAYLTIEDRKLGAEPSRRECSVIGKKIDPEYAIIILQDPPASGKTPYRSPKGWLNDWTLNSALGYQLRVRPLGGGWTLVRSEVDTDPVPKAETPWDREMKTWFSHTSK